MEKTGFRKKMQKKICPSKQINIYFNLLIFNLSNKLQTGDTNSQEIKFKH